ncbi:G-protein coupled receptor-like protein [Leptotrombidium deliense]|uniref:G-protein coupled receptor-like protein n=1 Tax=Leptotrombidium deliense TaxID=299467 RepID=A0A443SGE3_9ACAR|nr:G-protein coupled receptor-like protein [Leptotrombidium deliense]
MNNTTEVIASASVAPEIWTPLTIISLPLVIVIILYTAISNILVIYSIFTYPPLKNCQNLLLVSLAIADISNAIFVMPLNVYWNVVSDWPFNKLGCILHLTSDSYLCTTSIFNLVAIALDRYWAIFDPINYTQKRTTKFIIEIAIIAWALALLVTVIPCSVIPAVFDIFQWSENECHYPDGYILYVTWGQFVIPMIIMCIIYYLIYKAIQRQLQSRRDRQAKPTPGNVFVEAEKEGKSSSSNDTGIETLEESSQEMREMPKSPQVIGKDSVAYERSKNQNKYVINEREKISIARERRAVRVLAIVVGVFVFCWAPYFIVDNINYFWPDEYKKIPFVIINIVYWMGYVNSACNPIIYTIFNNDFRNAFKKIFHI